MRPRSEYVIICRDNEALITQFLKEIVIYQKQMLEKWAAITAQSPAAKIGYIGQHLASLIAGVPGTRSGARGDDLADGSEVKSCNKVDQADKCKDYGARVMRNQSCCPVCKSIKVERKDDSKWLFSVRSEEELKQYLQLDRILLILLDYPGFDAGDFSDIRISAYEIYPKEERMKVFGELISNHYYNIYRPKADKGLNTNPMNLHPFSFQFYKCNPVQTFRCFIKDIDSAPSVEIKTYVHLLQERGAGMPAVPMPTALLRTGEWKLLLENVDFDEAVRPCLTREISRDEFATLSAGDKCKYLPFLNEALRNLIPLREIKSVIQKKPYVR